MEMGSSSSTESLNGLKFGRKIYFEDSSSSSSSAQPKKVRSGPAQPGQPPRCQVEGCKADLSDAKAYYSRHKVCGMHSKSPKVIVAGIEQRFCQQCSRFHQLQEFDQGKRSCRRRLAGHNERRRKPPPGSLLSARFGPGGGGGRGSFLMDFSSYPRLGRDVWPPRRVPAAAYPPWQGVSENPPPPSDLFMHASVAAGHGGMIPDSSCALSLLSAQPWGPTSRPPAPGFGPRHSMMSSDELAGAGHFPAGSWSVVKAEGTGGDGGPHQAVVPDLGLGHVSQPLGGQFSGELELSHQQSRRPYLEAGHSRDFGSAGQHMNWSL